MMVKKFSCSDVGVNCGWSATANNENELLKKIQKHAESDHGISTISDELLSKVRSKIKDA